ncbi:LapA family protein [Jeotgalibacillus soli]|uniref:Lipopolysaccharide assembly protein A domain-containing protein n=1 Tax=Jeotgalibacillus soli TaxID=889306 RepID=A0A0C2R2Q2_9BACL|nr:lipopolysaccharide assembly protein LapA domain-containing protein [Jeotgalibacillus soli]KIL44525.1 hypothetical protein KP78_34890 [Jeotgalibacillus soli]
MKYQWTLIVGIIFTLIVTIFAVINVDAVTVNFGFAAPELPLIIVIVGSVLMGGLIVGSVGLFRLFVTQRKVKKLEQENESLNHQLAEMKKTSSSTINIENNKPNKTAPEPLQKEANIE